MSRRVRRHLILGVMSALLSASLYGVIDTDDPLFAWSMTTAYVSMALLVAALVVGPWRVLRGQAPTANSGLRRDLGIWGGAIAVLHVIIGIQVHFRGRPWLYFVPPFEQRGIVPLRNDLFGFANYTGLLATILVSVLLALSNDRALRRMGVERWKRWQRLNYYGMALIAAHGGAYQLIEGRSPGFVVLMLLLTVIAAVLQIAGYVRIRARRRKHAPVR